MKFGALCEERSAAARVQPSPRLSSGTAGPFSYAKGALYFVSSTLAVELLADDARSGRASQAMSTADQKLPCAGRRDIECGTLLLTPGQPMYLPWQHPHALT